MAADLEVVSSAGKIAPSVRPDRTEASHPTVATQPCGHRAILHDHRSIQGNVITDLSQCQGWKSVTGRSGSSPTRKPRDAPSFPGTCAFSTRPGEPDENEGCLAEPPRGTADPSGSQPSSRPLRNASLVW